MNLEPLYNLKERLDHIVIAGTNLIDDDFKLKNAIEDMSSLAAVNPVFGKIQAAANAIFTTEKEKRNKQILTVLGTVYAVIKTQGTIGTKELDGYEEVVTSERPHVNIPKSILSVMCDVTTENYAPLRTFLIANPMALLSTNMFKKTLEFYRHSMVYHGSNGGFLDILVNAIQNDKTGKYIDIVKESTNIYYVELLDALGDHAGAIWYAENITKFKPNDATYLYFQKKDVPAWLYVKFITAKKSKDIKDNIRIAKALISKHPGCPEIQEVLNFFESQNWETDSIITFMNSESKK